MTTDPTPPGSPPFAPTDPQLGPILHRFNLTELSGSFGDLGTFLPLAVAMALVCRLDFSIILICAGAMNILTGLCFRQPMPVQPMKAIAAVAITERLSAGDIAAAGLIMGVALVVLAASGTIDFVARWVPKSVVRGIQLGVGAKLVLTALSWIVSVDFSAPKISQHMDWIAKDHPLNDSIILVAIVTAGLLLPWARRGPWLLIIFLLGFAVTYATNPDAFSNVSMQWPNFHIVTPTLKEWQTGLIDGAIPQLPLTLINSVIAICALSADYFPGRGASPRKVGLSVGFMNLLCVPFGAMPMCHGAGGLAAQYRFGARTGGSVIMLGALKLITGLLLGASLIHLLDAYPVAILCAMLILAGVTLASAARDTRRGSPLLIVLLTAAAIVAIDTLTGFLIGVGVFLIFQLIKQRTTPSTTP